MYCLLVLCKVKCLLFVNENVCGICEYICNVLDVYNLFLIMVFVKIEIFCNNLLENDFILL